jgi:hypothetical protein
MLQYAGDVSSTGMNKDECCLNRTTPGVLGPSSAFPLWRPAPVDLTCQLHDIELCGVRMRRCSRKGSASLDPVIPSSKTMKRCSTHPTLGSRCNPLILLTDTKSLLGCTHVCAHPCVGGCVCVCVCVCARARARAPFIQCFLFQPTVSLHVILSRA